jgi:putative ABC transport system ATP-binding protein
MIHLSGIVKAVAAPQPFKLNEFSAQATDRIVLTGLDEVQAELFIHLVTGAVLPDEGRVQIGGHDTREIATDTEWLKSLDRFGIVTARAVLIDKLSAAANLALPLTVSIDPMSEDVRERVMAAGKGAGLSEGQLNFAVGELGPAARLRLHLARAVIGAPELILLEHPTAGLPATESAAFGTTLAKLAVERGFGWIAISNDDAFARASGGNRLALDSKTGKVRARRRWPLW